jgi:predicted 3-demethylubiquinone-9 3-methyltransferase (glyoxalase superfamily)
MARSVSTFLMFGGTAEEAMRWYVSLFPGAEVTLLEHFGPGEQGPEGSVKRASFTVCGHEVMCFDSPVQHAFTFTPAISLFVECDSADELDRLFGALSEGGEVFMPLNNYGFSTRFGWCNDLFGVSWQLNLA